jgi:hypothetical protein
MNTKLLLQLLLTAGCLALAMGLFEGTIGGGRSWLFSPVGWWRGAIACWMLIVAIRMVYPAQAK